MFGIPMITTAPLPAAVASDAIDQTQYDKEGQPVNMTPDEWAKRKAAQQNDKLIPSIKDSTNNPLNKPLPSISSLLPSGLNLNYVLLGIGGIVLLKLLWD